MISVDVSHVSKRYRRQTMRSTSTTLKSFWVNDLWRKRNKNLASETITQALTDVTFQIEQGKVFGIIGRNGSGKSTLLKLLANILRPDSGTLTVNGSTSAMIELGAGFHPELSGRENVVINGVILGLSKRYMQSKMEEIIEFSDLRHYIDQPVRTYSSGMYVRLGFAVAVNVDPQVILLDEVLAVGDLQFQRKCMNKMNEFREAGKTIILVTHDSQAVEQWCDEALWLNNGVMQHLGPARSTVQEYLRHA